MSQRTREWALNIYESADVNYKTGCLLCQQQIPVPDDALWAARHQEYFISLSTVGLKPPSDFSAHLCPDCFAYRKRATMPYRDYLKTPEWQALRAAKLKQARFRCELCFSEGPLHVHHKTYQHRGNENLDELIVLCLECHAKFHNKLPEEPL